MTNLYDRIEHLRSLVFFLCLLLLGATVLIGSCVIRISRLHDAQMGMVKAAHNRQVEIESLCEAVNNQEYIIRRNLPMVKMSWTAGLRAVCGQ